jgi:hypothetical protein
LFGGVLGHVLVTLELLQRVAFRLLRHVRCRDRLSQLRDLLALPAPSPSSRWIVATCSENCLALPLVERRLGLEADLVADAQDLYAHGEKPRDLVHARATRSTKSRISCFSFSYAARSEYGTALDG